MSAGDSFCLLVAVQLGLLFTVYCCAASGGTRSENGAPLITAKGRALDIPTVFPDGSIRFHIAVDSTSPDRDAVVVPAGGRQVATMLFDDSFDTGKKHEWRDVIGATTAEGGKLTAGGYRNEVLVDGLKEENVDISVDADGSVQMGILVRFQNADNFVLAFYSPAQRILGFHEKVDGDWGPWISPVPTNRITGSTAHVAVKVCGGRVNAAVTDEQSHTVSSSFTINRLTTPGGIGLYHDTLAKPGLQRFDNFQVARIERIVPANAIQIIVPASVAGTNFVWIMGDRVKVTGIEGKAQTIKGVLRAITVEKGTDIAAHEHSPTSKKLFPTRLPGKDWVRFRADGFSAPVCGVIYRAGDTVTNGMPLGGIDTGCVDLETSGLLGYCTVFNTHVPRRGPINLPLLGLSVGGKTWVLCRLEPRDGAGAYQPSAGGKRYRLWRDKGWVEDKAPITPISTALRLDGVETVKEIQYWGHYPVADIEFETDAPISVGLRAWSPFLPGDVVGSMLPGVVLEVHLRNASKSHQEGTIALSFPGPTRKEAGTDQFTRRRIHGDFKGVEVSAEKASYAIGVIGEGRLRWGGELGADGEAWAKITTTLPVTESGKPGSSVAVDFSLPPGETKVVRFILSWHAPDWNAGGYNWSGAEHTFTHTYAKYYASAQQAAELLVRNHDSLLRRILAWQQVIYTEQRLPVWLRESLVNVMHLITEDSLWAQAKPPLPDWVKPEDGLFGMNECPRGCPQIECIPCSFYGNQPLVYFFPEAALSTLRGYKGYQYPDGAAVWIFGGCTGNTPPIDFANPTRGYQFVTNGISLAAMADRYYLCYGDKDKSFLKEFYPIIKQNMTYTVNLRPEYPIGDRIIAMPTRNVGAEWFEAPEPGWRGMTAHVGGLHLAQLRIAERMAKDAGDAEFTEQCAEWIKAGAESMERKLWTGSYYLNYWEPETESKSDLVFGYQLDGEWITDHHGLPSALPEERVKTTLETIKRCNIANSKYGAANYANADGAPAQVGGYGVYSFFPPEALMLAMTYMYNGEKEFGLELARKVWQNIVCRQGYTWDMPNIMRGDVDTGERTFGNDYYQDLMLWSLPAAIEGDNFGAPSKPGGLVDRIIKAARDGGA